MTISETKFNEIVCELYNRFANDPVPKWPSVQMEFVRTPRDKLQKYHHSLGRSIRNEFGLWNFIWEPEVVGGVDYSPDHPDAVSMRIIEDLWDKLKVLYEISTEHKD